MQVPWLKLQASSFISSRVRRRMLMRAGIAVGSGSTIYPHNFFGGNNMEIGSDCFISLGCIFDTSAKISIGSNTHMAFGARIATSSHELAGSEQRAGKLTSAPVSIETGCWIGAGVTILPGVVVGRGCVIAAGAVLTESTKPDALYGGVPAVWKRAL